MMFIHQLFLQTQWVSTSIFKCTNWNRKACHNLVVVWPNDLNTANREYLGPQINNRFHSEAKQPWPYDYPLANHIATNKSSANRDMTLFLRLYPSFGYLRKSFPPGGIKILPIKVSRRLYLNAGLLG